MQTTSAKPFSDTDSTFDIRDWQKGYLSQPNEFDYWIDEVEGEIPADLHGTLFRNGPGLLDINGQPIEHPFDGDGMVCAIAFAEGRAHFRNRFVRTEGYLAEQAAGKILYRGTFGTQKPGGWLANIFDLRLKNIANTQVIYWGEKLLALWEGGEPHRLDPATLDTLGIDLLDSVLKSGDTFAAHPRIDPSCDRTDGEPCLVNFAVKPGMPSQLTLYELNQAGQVVQQQSHSLDGFAFMHDFAITPNYAIFFQNPVQFNPLPYLLGWRGAAQCIDFAANQPTKVLVVPRQGGTMHTLETESCFVFHHANAFEQDGRLFVDSVCYESFPSVDPDSDYRNVDFDALPPGQLWRFEIDLTANRVQHKLLESRCCEFPSTHPRTVGRPYRYLYIGATRAATGNAPLQAVLKLDLETGERQLWNAGPCQFGGEPVFVPRPNSTAEDDGWVMVMIYDATSHRSELAILDGQDLRCGPLARLHLKHHVPYGLHGTFTPQCFGPER